LPIFSGVLDTAQKFSTGINDTGKDFLAVSLTPPPNFKTKIIKYLREYSKFVKMPEDIDSYTEGE